MITKIDLINELFNEIEFTLNDIQKERLAGRVKGSLTSSAENYIRFVHDRLMVLKVQAVEYVKLSI